MRKSHFTSQSLRVDVLPEKIFNFFKAIHIFEEKKLRSFFVMFVFHSPFKYVIKIFTYFSFNTYAFFKIVI